MMVAVALVSSETASSPRCLESMRCSHYTVSMRSIALLLLIAGLALGASEETIRGTLTSTPAGEPALKTSAGKLVRLQGDAETRDVIRDERLEGADLEVRGKFTANDLFRIGPFHKRSMWIWKQGHKHFVSYWCSVCSIRTYTPGICMCCQDETELDLRTENEIEQ